MKQTMSPSWNYCYHQSVNQKSETTISNSQNSNRIKKINWEKKIRRRIWITGHYDQLVFGSGIGKRPAPAAPRGGANPRNFWRFVRMLIEQRKYKNAIEQSVMSSPGNPRWLIFWTSRMGTKGNFATGFPSNRLLRNPKTRKRTTATTNPDLNLKSERSRLDSLSEVSTRSIFLVLDFLVVRKAAGLEDSRVFMVSSFLEALSMEDFRDL